jgi:hypothetical protein
MPITLSSPVLPRISVRDMVAKRHVPEYVVDAEPVSWVSSPLIHLLPWLGLNPYVVMTTCPSNDRGGQLSKQQIWRREFPRLAPLLRSLVLNNPYSGGRLAVMQKGRSPVKASGKVVLVPSHEQVSVHL